MTEKLSRLADDLKPYIAKQVNAALRGGAAAAAAGGAGGLTKHALSGTYHEGTLADAQGPQFPLLSGGRVYTGNIVLLDELTVDGVDISEHAANPSAHHNPVTAGNTGIGLSGQAVSLALAATSGLVIASGLKVGAGAGITVNANDVALTVPGSLSVTSANTAAGNHTHAVTASSDVSAGVAALLKSTAAGGLGLASLFTTGAADIGQGLTAANTAFRVINHTHDYPHSHVVINPTGAWNLDEQFGLDVDDNLLVRGWIVGKHAIQVDGAKMLVHFDGPPPVETNWVGTAIGHMGQASTLTGTPAWYLGKFNSKGIGITAGGTNLIRDPVFGNATIATCWSGSATRDASFGLFGLASAYYSGAASSNVIRNGGYNITAANGETVWFNAFVYVSMAGMARAQIFSDTLGTLATGAGGGTVGEWSLLGTVWTNTTGSSQTVRVEIETTASGHLWMDGFSVNIGASPTVMAAGDMPNGTWTGSANASSTTVAGAGVSYADTTIVSTARGSIALWFRAPWGHEQGDSSSHALFSMGASGNFHIVKYNANPTWAFATGGGVELSFRLDLNGAEDTEWHYGVITYDVAADESEFFLDGVSIATGTCAAFSAGTLYVGREQSSNYLDGYIDDFCVFDRVLPTDEIRAIYESNAPVFAETSTWQWRAGRNRIYVDAEGMWGYGASGGAILGLYAGEDNNPSATKSWGGVNLSEGDFLLGRYGAANGGWMLFDQDLVSGLPAWRFGYADQDVIRLDAGGASLYGVLDIDTAGGIYQGSGSFASPTTGLKVWNDTGVGRIAGYNGGTVQWYAGTDGKLYAGGGVVTLDANGLSLPFQTGFARAGEISFVSGGSVITRITSGADVLGQYAWLALYGPGDAAIRMRQAIASGIEDVIIEPSISTGDIRSTGIAAIDSGGLPLEDDGGNEAARVMDGGVFSLPKIRSSGTITNLADDAATTITPGTSVGLLYIGHFTGTTTFGELMWRVTATNNNCAVIAQAGTVIAATTGALTGTTGTDGKLTISTHTDGKIYVENRTGATRSLNYFLIELG